jgi:hypothetical protein
MMKVFLHGIMLTIQWIVRFNLVDSCQIRKLSTEPLEKGDVGAARD